MLFEAIFVPRGEESLSPSILQAPDIAKYIINWGEGENDIAVVAKMDNKLVGAIWGRLFSEDNKGYGFINDQTPEIAMAVLASFRNRGVGKELLLALESRYRALEIKAVSLSVDKRNPAKRLYERNGFSIYKDLGNSITMHKKI